VHSTVDACQLNNLSTLLVDRTFTLTCQVEDIATSQAHKRAIFPKMRRGQPPARALLIVSRG